MENSTIFQSQSWRTFGCINISYLWLGSHFFTVYRLFDFPTPFSVKDTQRAKLDSVLIMQQKCCQATVIFSFFAIFESFFKELFRFETPIIYLMCDKAWQCYGATSFCSTESTTSQEGCCCWREMSRENFQKTWEATFFIPCTMSIRSHSIDVFLGASSTLN